MKRELNKYLATLSDKELIREIKKLYDKFPAVKAYYAMELSADTEAIVEEYKKKIRNEYFPTRGYGDARNSVSNKVISDFKKIAVHQKDVVTLLLYRAEMMIEYSNAYGDIDAAFYNSLITSFRKACEVIQSERLEQYYRNYCQELISASMNFGWGVYDELRYYYDQCFVNG